MSQIGLIRLIGLIVVSGVFLWIFFSDLVYGAVPDLAVASGMIGGIAVHQGEQFGPYLLSAIGAALFFLLLVVITRGKGMGTGDVTLAALVGFLLGWPGTVVAVWLAFVTGAFVGILLIVMKRKTLKQTVPFGPFLIAATVAAPLVAPWLDKLFMFGVK